MPSRKMDVKGLARDELLAIDTLKILITSAGKKSSLTKKLIQEAKEANVGRKVYTCDKNPESISGIVEPDGCFKVPICTSEDYIETIWSLCLEHDIGTIISMTEREFVILSANKDMFAKYGVNVLDGKKSVIQ